MAVRNFYVEANIDGRKTRLGGGPRCKDGEMSLCITQRNTGGIDTALRINCYVNSEGNLVTAAFHRGQMIFEYVTDR